MEKIVSLAEFKSEHGAGMSSSTRDQEALGCDFSRQCISPGTAQIHLLSRAVAWTEPFSERNFVVVVVEEDDLVGRCLAINS